MIIKTFLSFISIIFSLLMIYITVINFKKKVLTKFEFLIWNIVWAGIIFISVRPHSIDDYFSENYNIDIFYIITILSIISLLIFSYFNMLKIKILEKKIDTIIRAESLKDLINRINEK